MLLDTSGLLCFLHAPEPRHEQAVVFMHTASLRITHNYVLAEFVALAGVRRLPRPRVLEFVFDLEDNPLVNVVYVDKALHHEALVLLQQRLDKTWSLCDAVSFLVMEHWGIGEALTTDAHFDQAGFRRLLSP